MLEFVWLCVLIIGYIIQKLLVSIRKPNNFPPGPYFLPLLGSGWKLRREARYYGGQHMVFENWSKQFKSNILGLKLGDSLVIVVLSYDLVREIHLQDVFEGRPDTFFFRLRTMGTRKGITGTDGPLWYQQRLFAMKQMRNIGYGRTRMCKHIENEAKNLIDYIHEIQNIPVTPNRFLSDTVINVLWTMVAGRRFDNKSKQLDRLFDLMNQRSKLFDMSGGILTQFPWLRFIAPNKTGYNLICQLNDELHLFFKNTIDEHRRTLNENNADDDFIYAFLYEMQQNEKNSDKTMLFFDDKQLTMTILDFFIAGSQTTSLTMEIALMILALRNDIQQYLYEEIRRNSIANPDEFPHLDCKHKFPYTNAFLMEVQRLYLVVPISGPRRALWKTKFNGYDVPKDTIILISLHSIAMDKEHWGDPEQFRPERFLNMNKLETINDPYFMPFGQGRRRCLGDTLARACLFAFLVKIVCTFQIALSDNINERPNMQLRPGITLSPQPYKIRFIKRL